MENQILNVGLINLVPDEDAPPMNLVALCTYLKRHEINVSIIDSTYDKHSLDRHLNNLDLIGISSMTASYNKAVLLAEQLRKTFNKPIIIGGTHISLVPESLESCFTAGVMGEGEQVLLNLCIALKKAGALTYEQLSEIPGLVYWSNGVIAINEKCEQIKTIDSLPMPDFDFLNKRYFNKRWIDWSGKVGVSMHISTSRGCPYKCIFCSGQRLWKKVRFQSAGRIMSEVMELVTNYGVDHIVIDDDLFLSNKKRLEEMANLIENSDVSGKVSFLCSARANLINTEMCQILKRIGIKALNFGFESGSEEMLSKLKGDNVTAIQNRQAIEMTREYGFEVSGNLIMGSPGETIEAMMETIDFMDFAIKHGCFKVGVFVLTPLPGTPLWVSAKERGLVKENMDWDLLSFYASDNPMFLDSDVPLENFKDLFETARKKSYQGWLKNRWWKMLRNDSRRVFRKVIENPKRAGVMMKSIMLSRSVGS